MKKQYLLIFSLLFIITISIGFAALSRNLNISGLTSVKENKWDIYFSRINNMYIDGMNISRNQIDYSVTLNKPGDKKEFYFNVVNDGTIDAMVILLENDNISDELKEIINYSITYSDGEEIKEKNLLYKGSFETFKVVVEYKKDIQKEELLNEDVNLDLTINLEYKQADEEALPRNVNRNYIVRDLSGNNNDAFAYKVEKNEDGSFLLNNYKEPIDCGLTNYDFKNSISMVIRLKFHSRLTSQNYFFGNWETAGSGIYVENYKFYWGIFDKEAKDYKDFVTNYSPQLNTWYTLVGTYDGTALRFYINGEAIPDENGNLEYPVTGDIRVSYLPFFIGGNPPYNSILSFSSNITVSSALIFDRALTEEEISTNYVDVINPTNKDRLLAYYEFN